MASQCGSATLLVCATRHLLAWRWDEIDTKRADAFRLPSACARLLNRGIASRLLGYNRRSMMHR